MNRDDVGPVFENDPLSDKIIEAMRLDNPKLLVEDEFSYRRVLVAHKCILRRETIERVLGHEFLLPQDLEKIMPSFKGKISVSEDQVTWSGLL